jgi:hypothetical protein
MTLAKDAPFDGPVRAEDQSAAQAIALDFIAQ